MKKVLILTWLILFGVSAVACAAPVSADAKQAKVFLWFKYYNTSSWGMTTKSVREDVVENNVVPVLVKNNSEIVTDDKYWDKLKSKGYSDSTSVERADLLDAYKDDGFRYLIFIDMEPIRKASIGYESSAHVKILDMESAKYLHNGKVVQMTKWGGAGTVADKLGKDIAKILEGRVFGK